MELYIITDMTTFKIIPQFAESPELALIQVHSNAVGDPRQHKYNDHLKNLCYNGDNIGLGSFCYFSRRRSIMVNNGNFRIEIGVTKTGITGIGCGFIRDNDIDDSEYVYGAQIKHRVAALTSHGWRVMTPTEAKKGGYEYIRGFPPATR